MDRITYTMAQVEALIIKKDNNDLIVFYSAYNKI